MLQGDEGSKGISREEDEERGEIGRRRGVQ